MLATIQKQHLVIIIQTKLVNFLHCIGIFETKVIWLDYQLRNEAHCKRQTVFKRTRLLSDSALFQSWAMHVMKFMLK